jgi:hypothetical protein
MKFLRNMKKERIKYFIQQSKFFYRRGCLVIRKSMAMTNIKLDRNFCIIAITHKLFP